jgi:hypothetical protein
MKEKKKTFQVQSVHNVVLGTNPLRTGKRVWFTGTHDECWRWFKSTDCTKAMDRKNISYKSRSVMIREVFLEND